MATQARAGRKQTIHLFCCRNESRTMRNVQCITRDPIILLIKWQKFVRQSSNTKIIFIRCLARNVSFVDIEYTLMANVQCDYHEIMSGVDTERPCRLTIYGIFDAVTFPIWCGLSGGAAAAAEPIYITFANPIDSIATHRPQRMNWIQMYLKCLHITSTSTSSTIVVVRIRLWSIEL